MARSIGGGDQRVFKKQKVDLFSPNTGFGDLRNAELFPQFQYTFTNGLIDEFTVTEFGNGGRDPIVDRGMLMMNTGPQFGPPVPGAPPPDPTPGAFVRLKSRQCVKTRAGFGLSIRFSAVFGPGRKNTLQYAGWGDEEDGFFFGVNGEDFGVLHRTNTSPGGVRETWFPQNTWRDINFDIDYRQGNVFEIQTNYMGFGNVNFLMQNYSTGRMELVFSIRWASNHTVPSLLRPNLPFTAYIFNEDGESPSVRMQLGGIAALIEGTRFKNPLHYSIDNKNDRIRTDSECVWLLRPKPTFQGRENTFQAFPTCLTASIDGSREIFCCLLLNPTLSGTTPVWQDVDSDNSFMEYSTTQDVLATGGKQKFCFVLSDESKATYYLQDIFEGFFFVADEIFALVANTSSGSTDIYSSIVWQEDL